MKATINQLLNQINISAPWNVSYAKSRTDDALYVKFQINEVRYIDKVLGLHYKELITLDIDSWKGFHSTHLKTQHWYTAFKLFSAIYIVLSSQSFYITYLLRALFAHGRSEHNVEMSFRNNRVHSLDTDSVTVVH